MCAISLCLQQKWTPAIQPQYRPPARGWPLRELPEDLAEPLRAAWHVRRKQEVRNPGEAIIEAAKFIEMNGGEVTKELIGSLRLQADYQYCTDEPSRCARKVRLPVATASKAPPAEVNGTAAPRAARVPVRTPKARASKPRRCCGR